MTSSARIRAGSLLLGTLLLLPGAATPSATAPPPDAATLRQSEANRERWQPPGRILDSLAVRPGMVVADVGAGDGYLTLPLAERVGPTGKVYAEDIDRRALSTLQRRAGRAGLANIETIAGTVTDPQLPEGALDLIVMVYAFHHFSDYRAMLEAMQPSLKPGAAVAIIERDPDRYTYGDRSHWLRRATVEQRVAEAGFVLERVLTFLDRDNIYLLRLPDSRGSNCP